MKSRGIVFILLLALVLLVSASDRISALEDPWDGFKYIDSSHVSLLGGLDQPQGSNDSNNGPVIIPNSWFCKYFFIRVVDDFTLPKAETSKAKEEPKPEKKPENKKLKH